MRVFRWNLQEKLKDLMERMEECFIEMQHQMWLTKTSRFAWFLRVFTSKRMRRNLNINFFLCLLLNGLCVMWYERPGDQPCPSGASDGDGDATCSDGETPVLVFMPLDRILTSDEKLEFIARAQEDRDYSLPFTKKLNLAELILKCVGLLIILFAFTSFICYLFVWAPVTFRVRALRKRRQKKGLGDIISRHSAREAVAQNTMRSQHTKHTLIDFRKARGRPARCWRALKRKTKEWAYWAKLVDPKLVYYFVYLGVAFCGVWYDPAFFGLLLLDIVIRDPTTRNIAKAIMHPLRALVMTLILAIFVVYNYGMITFFFFNGDAGDMDQCRNLAMCVFDTITRGMRSDEGIGSYMHEVDPGTEHVGAWYLRGYIDFSFFLIMVIILLNIVFGIIIDTFGDLRRQREKKKQDLFHKCQICAKNAAEFDRHADGFDVHWTRDHNIWSYIFFYVHLKTKPKLDFTGVEAYVYKCLQEHSIAWFPLHKAMSLRRKGLAAEEDLSHRLASIERHIVAMQHERQAAAQAERHQRLSVASLLPLDDWRDDGGDGGGGFAGGGGGGGGGGGAALTSEMRKMTKTMNHFLEELKAVRSKVDKMERAAGVGKAKQHSSAGEKAKKDEPRSAGPRGAKPTRQPTTRRTVVET